MSNEVSVPTNSQKIQIQSNIAGMGSLRPTSKNSGLMPGTIGTPNAAVVAL